MSHFVTLVSSSFTRKEAILAHIKVKALETAIPRRRSSLSIIMKWRDVANLNPNIGFCLHMLHLAWCFAVSAAVNLQYKCLEKEKKRGERTSEEWNEWNSFHMNCVFIMTVSTCLDLTGWKDSLNDAMQGGLSKSNAMTSPYFIFQNPSLPVKDRKPDHALRLLFHPIEKVESLNELLIPGRLKTWPHTRLYVRPSKGLNFSQDSWNLRNIVK